MKSITILKRVYVTLKNQYTHIFSVLSSDTVRIHQQTKMKVKTSLTLMQIF